jgi:hypothetical protein
MMATVGRQEGSGKNFILAGRRIRYHIAQTHDAAHGSKKALWFLQQLASLLKGFRRQWVFRRWVCHSSILSHK